MMKATSSLRIGAEADALEYDVVWDLDRDPPAGRQKLRKYRRVAYAVIAGPEDILTAEFRAIQRCVLDATEAIGLARILQDPVDGARQLYDVALARCAGWSIGDDYAKLSLAVTALLEVDEWSFI